MQCCECPRRLVVVVSFCRGQTFVARQVDLRGTLRLHLVDLDRVQSFSASASARFRERHSFQILEKNTSQHDIYKAKFGLRSVAQATQSSKVSVKVSSAQILWKARRSLKTRSHCMSFPNPFSEGSASKTDTVKSNRHEMLT